MRAGEMLLEDTYELDVGTPRAMVEGVKVEVEDEDEDGKGRGVAMNTSGRAKRAKRAKMEVQVSDTTLVFSPPSARKHAYTHGSSSLPTSRSTSRLPPGSPPALSSSPALSSPPPSVQVRLQQQEWCTRDLGSVFTYSLCPLDSVPPTPSIFASPPFIESSSEAQMTS
ncbi:hypothetical protein Hypma_000024 [Hypsizygus marmoreus]|uniref:Uncharacterized protein n=1 Tax=Hypsizygus marmoreus TaxID=39966 RepID=A0A369K930_HYPMA|nr:hypothetical protein Hypma_000024 [Hypsizygus marmoreus]